MNRRPADYESAALPTEPLQHVPGEFSPGKYSFIILADLFTKNKGLQRKIFRREIRKLLLPQRFAFCGGINEFAAAAYGRHDPLARAEHNAAVLLGVAVQTIGTARCDIFFE